MPLTLEIATPEARIYSGSVDSLVIPTVDGEIGILPGHLPLLTQLDSGDLRLTTGANTRSLAIRSGFAQVVGDKVAILSSEIDHALEDNVRPTDGTTEPHPASKN